MVSFGNFNVAAVILILLTYFHLPFFAHSISTQEKVDLLVHFTDYLPRNETINTINSLLIKQNLSHSLPPIENIVLGEYTDFLKIQLDAEVVEDAKRILEKLPSFKTFSLDRKIKAALKESSFRENNPYNYVFPVNLTEELKLKEFWDKGITGKGIKIAIFDTGISDAYKKTNKDNIKEIINLSSEKYAEGTDFSGHGTFVTSIITHKNKECRGIAPGAELYVYKVFTKTEETSYSWFLEAFNQCIKKKVNLISFSIGSTNLIEKTFIDKIKEVIRKNITIIAAAGNDGFFGTMNHPADLAEVLAVGGVSSDGKSIAGYSSRGMTNSETSTGMGRIKPDIVALSKDIIASDIDGECVTRSGGTSFAVPVVTGSLALILSSLPAEERAKVNPAMIRQALVETARKLDDATMFEQGAGLFNINQAYEYFHKKLVNKISIFPSYLNLTEEESYTFPYSIQPLYYSGMPTILNLTIINSNPYPSKVSKIEFQTSSLLRELIKVSYESSSESFDQFGHISLIIRVTTKGALTHLRTFPVINGVVNVYFKDVEKPASVQLMLQMRNTPPREKRILWDQFHNMNFPESGFIPRDSLQNADYPYEWISDHPYINFFHLFRLIQKQGYFLEILRGSFECFDATKYGILLIVDPEEKYTEAEKLKLEEDVVLKGLSVILFADWYDPHLLTLNTFEPKIQSSSQKPATKIPSTPVTGGSNIPALNSLLENFGIAFGTSSYAGDFTYGNRTHSYLSGSYIIRFPRDGALLTFKLFNESNLVINKRASTRELEPKPILGLLKNIYGHPVSGKFIVYGDSNCIDSAFMINDCFDLFKDMLRFYESGTMNLFDHFHNYEIPQDYVSNETVVYYDEAAQPLMKDFSKHENSKMWNKTLCCESYRPADKHVDFTDLLVYFERNVTYSPLSDWVSKPKDGSSSGSEDYTVMEHIQMLLMTLSVLLIVFIVFLVRRRRRRFRYSPMERAKGQVIIV